MERLNMEPLPAWLHKQLSEVVRGTEAQISDKDVPEPTPQLWVGWDTGNRLVVCPLLHAICYCPVPPRLSFAKGLTSLVVACRLLFASAAAAFHRRLGFCTGTKENCWQADTRSVVWIIIKLVFKAHFMSACHATGWTDGPVSPSC